MRLHTLLEFILVTVAAFGNAPADMITGDSSILEVAGADASARNSIGVEQMSRFLYSEAADEFRNALAEDPNYNLARINLGIALYYDAEFDAAQQVFEEALARDPANPYANYSLGLVLKHKGLTDGAEVRFKRVVD